MSVQRAGSSAEEEGWKNEAEKGERRKGRQG
jgi:hypothetical protein